MGLIRIQKTTQKVADAIAAVLDVDVSIVDEKLYRVAATGRNKNKIGERLPENCAFEMVEKNKEPMYIENPGSIKACSNCSVKGKCDVMSTIGYPIIDSDKLIGVIGIIAFDMRQKERIHKNYKSLLIFLGTLGSLISESLSNLKLTCCASKTY
ncbi:GAF domain-containing protein [Proteiniborus sp. MB09-C3]|uniref:GAF domain-containing protein n=1 Tax=Proteiniborus sp. MB09-C3 TaxID=3050072 RepID=UPI0025535C3C|nr:GAF domain-containing protein [Proteiniborus sp. MB09-C3]WIV12027.1 hypothetical protein QO263_18325 [Proteiniborus sp. MB09-C3]